MQSIGKNFLYYTEIENLAISNEEKGVPEPHWEKEIPDGAEIIKLPIEEFSSQKSLQETIDSRKSIRKFAEGSITLLELSQLLWNTQGVKRRVKDRSVTKRTVPSAGARHAFETYLYINRVDELKPGLYRYIASTHALYPIDVNFSIVNLQTACLGQKFVSSSAVLFIWTAIAERMVWRYGERGYRYLFLDAGHVCQNLYLTAEEIDLGVCAIGAYSDKQIHDLLSIDGEQEFAIYLTAVGKKIERF